MARTRDFRRWQYELRKTRVRKHFRRWDWDDRSRPTNRQVGLTANTPHPCSCYMCGNPRKYWNELTRQEMRAQVAWDYDHRP